MKLAYRKDIDGLRAIAVLAVLFFHAEIPGFSGGFVGVDIFFVISGYLITSILLQDLRDGNFSIARFYERRIKRIFPALFPVILFTIIMGAWIYEPETFKDLGKSVVATTLFYSNVHFLNGVGYFDTPSLEKPLLHTWSLAVEEQFYIFFPLFLLLVHRYFKQQYFLPILVLALTSLLMSIWGVYEKPEAAFYLVHTRAWELLAGSLLAMGIFRKPALSSTRIALSLVGLVLIGYSIATYSHSTPFPGLYAIPPVLGAALIIYSESGESSYIMKILGSKPLVFIGLISYSLYLWHWVFIALSRYILLRGFQLHESLAVIAVSFIFSIISWRYIEQPFRGQRSILSERRAVFLFAIVLISVVAMSGEYIRRQDGMPYRYPEAQALELSNSISKYCRRDAIATVDGAKVFKIGSDNTKPSFLLWGDSHAERLMPSLYEMGCKHGKSGYAITRGEHPPLLGIKIFNGRNYDENASGFNDAVLSFVESHPEVRTVILAGIWGRYANGHRYRETASTVDLIDTKEPNVPYSNLVLLRKGLFRTVNSLHKIGRKVIIVNDVPELGVSARHKYWISSVVFAGNHLGHHFSDELPSRSDYALWNRGVDRIMNDLALLDNVSILHAEESFFSQEGRVLMIADGVLLYDDADHLSSYGAHFIASVFNDLFTEI